MATINYEYQEDKVLYDSGPVEDFILNKYKNGEKVSLEDEGCFYSYVEARENIVNWYPFKENSTILELGAGIGSVTGALCKKAKKVVSCEYSRKRADSLYYRHKEKDNLEVIVGNFKTIEFKEKFDYIVLIGVFEYAKRFYDTNNPFEDFLNDMKRLLKPGGVILIAIENRYGIKYWAGAKEDHFGEKYVGLYGYDSLDIVTFGKEEILKIVEKVGFKNYKFYYPYPDYKVPYVIYTDERLPLFTEIPTFKLYNHGEQKYNFDYRDILPGMLENGQYDFFSNSFLIELSTTRNSVSDIAFVKTFWSRTKKYDIHTIIKSDGRILKIPKNEESLEHLEKMIETHNKIANLNIKVSKITKRVDLFESERINGMNLAEYFYYLVCEKDKANIIKEFKKYYEFVMSISKEEKIKKFAIPIEKKFFINKFVNVLKINLIDLNMSNIIKNDSEYYLIDQEWISEYSIPSNYILYFSILLLYNSVKKLELIVTKEEIYDLFNINQKEMEIYSKMSEFFAFEEQKSTDMNLSKLFEKENIIKLLDDEHNKLNTLNIEKENIIKLLNDEQNRLNTLNIELENKINEINQKYKDEEEKNNQMINSKRWKIVQWIFKPMDKFKGR